MLFALKRNKHTSHYIIVKEKCSGLCIPDSLIFEIFIFTFYSNIVICMPHNLE